MVLACWKSPSVQTTPSARELLSTSIQSASLILNLLAHIVIISSKKYGTVWVTVVKQLVSRHFGEANVLYLAM